MRFSSSFFAVSSLSALFAILPCFAWQAGAGAGAGASPGGNRGAGTPTTPTNPSIPGRTPTNPTSPFPGNGNQYPQEMQRPMFISGKVVADDGLPPPDTATIEIICNGQPRPLGYTDRKGRFSLTLGGPGQAIMMDASTASMDAGLPGSNGGMGRGGNMGNMGPTGMGGIRERDLMGCEVRAALPGYQSDIIQLNGRRFMDNPDVGMIALHRLTQVQGMTFSMTSAMAPKDARKEYEKGFDLLKKKKADEAEKHLTKAVEIYPKYAEAWYELGLSREIQQRKPEAIEAYQQALASDSKFIRPHLRMMGFAVKESKWPELLQTSNDVLRLNPVNYPEAWFYNSVANLQLSKLDDAEKSAREALRIDSAHQYPKIGQVLGVILAQKQDYPGALQFMKGYLKAAPEASDADRVKQQIAELEKAVTPGPNKN
jgi:tetratricopeptide (TPR) repeat protein